MYYFITWQNAINLFDDKRRDQEQWYWWNTFSVQILSASRQWKELRAGFQGSMWYRSRPRVHDTHTVYWNAFIKMHEALLRGVAIAISMIVEDTQVSTLEQIYFHTCWVRCLQFLPALSLFVLLLSVNLSRGRQKYSLVWGFLLLRWVPFADVTLTQQLSRRL